MAPTLATVLNIIPGGIFVQLQKFLSREKVIVTDIPFKLSTKYTPALLIVMICFSFANQFVRNVEIDCTATSSSGGNRGGFGGGAGETELNNYCWNYETFLVAKALQPSWRGRVTYPGVHGYDKGQDELVRQRYYKYVWLVLTKMAVFSFLPLFLWKVSSGRRFNQKH